MRVVGQQGNSRAGAGQRFGSKRFLVKSVAWLLAIPALCALVVLGGAAPIYLFLPEAPSTPAHQDSAAVSDAGTEPGDTAIPIETAAAFKQAPVEQEAAGSKAMTKPPPAADDAVPPAEEVEQLAEAETSVVPTPRPAIEVAALATTAEDNAGSTDRRAVRRDSPDLSSSPKAKTQDPVPKRRSVTIRPVALRSGPSGREIKALGRGAEVVVGPCKDWCQVEADGVAGWLHPSFLADAGKAKVRSRPEERAVAPRPAVRRDGHRVIRERPRPYRAWRAERPERYVDDERWPAEERDPVEFYGYE